VVANGLNPATTAVRSLLRPPIVIAHEHEDASEALERMRTHAVRRLPIVGSEGKLVGIITFDDVLQLVAADINALVEIVAREQGREHRLRR
jgi:CBS domain-containing protein